MTYKISLPIKILSENNRRDHWAVKAKRVKMQRNCTLFTFVHDVHKLRVIAEDKSTKFAVHMVRIKGKGGRDYDDDGLVSGFKAVRDEIASLLGINDGNRDRIRFTCAQEKGEKHGARIEITKVTEFKND